MCGCVSIFQEQKPYVRLKINVKLGIDVSFTHHVLEKVIKCPLEILWLFFSDERKVIKQQKGTNYKGHNISTKSDGETSVQPT